MPKFMDVHEAFVGARAEQLKEAHEADLAHEGAEGVHFEQAWLDPESGKVFCLSTGPSKEAASSVLFVRRRLELTRDRSTQNPVVAPTPEQGT